MRQAPYVGVVGAAVASPLEYERGRAVGRGLAERGAVVVCGGLGGVMEAACHGAREAGGMTIGILPGLDRRAANAAVEVAIATGLGELRNGLIVRAADSVIAVGGELGTLSEIALALKVRRAVVGLGTWDLRRGGDQPRGFVPADDPRDAVAQALELCARSARLD